MATLKKTPILDWTNYVIGYECVSKEIQIMVCEKSHADKIISKHHYSKKSAKNSLLSFLDYWKEELHGAMQSGYGIRRKINGEYIPDEIREFDRKFTVQ